MTKIARGTIVYEFVIDDNDPNFEGLPEMEILAYYRGVMADDISEVIRTNEILENHIVMQIVDTPYTLPEGAR
jgi:hypothetical protein